MVLKQLFEIRLYAKRTLRDNNTNNIMYEIMIKIVRLAPVVAQRCRMLLTNHSYRNVPVLPIQNA